MSREIPRGTGFYIWQIKSLLPVERAIEALKRAKASWVSIKVADGNTIYNRIKADGTSSRDDAFLLQYIAALRAAGISVGGWQYIYPLPTANPGSQSGLAGERFVKLDLDHFLVDAEHDRRQKAYWITLEDGSPNLQRNYSATQYMGTLKPNGIPSVAPVALSSHRFPEFFVGFPFRQFAHGRGDAAKDFVAPQVYWEGAHNPVTQLLRCLEEYEQAIGSGFTYVPIGSTYAAGDPVWEPTIDDLQAFIAKAKELGCPGWGFWSLDWIVNHDKTAWLDAIAGEVTPPTPPPPPTPVEPGLHFRVTAPVLNIRSGPGTQYADIGDLYEGQILTAQNIAAIGEAWVEFEPGKWAALKAGGKQYLEVVE